jgi:segregation and condensation protein A
MSVSSLINPNIQAKIHGELISEFPQDLYIPPDALEVYLESFEGPLDLLLYLIRKNNVDILNIPMLDLTNQYMAYVEKMKQIKLELAADYLLMTAMLIEIKSRMLVPKPNSSEEEEDDPRSELVRRLIEYELVKEAAINLNKIPQLGHDRISPEIFFKKVVKTEYPDIELQDLFEAWQNVLKRAQQLTNHKIDRSELSVREHMSYILRMFDDDENISFDDLFLKEPQPLQKLVVCFLAILELSKESMIKIFQQNYDSKIYLMRT